MNGRILGAYENNTLLSQRLDQGTMTKKNLEALDHLEPTDEIAQMVRSGLIKFSKTHLGYDQKSAEFIGDHALAKLAK